MVMHYTNTSRVLASVGWDRNIKLSDIPTMLQAEPGTQACFFLQSGSSLYGHI